MNLTSDPIDFLADDVVPAVTSAVDQATDQLADLPAVLGALAGSASARSWSRRGASTIGRRYPLFIGAAVVLAGAAFVWRRRKGKNDSKSIEFPSPEKSSSNGTAGDTNTTPDAKDLTAPTNA